MRGDWHLSVIKLNSQVTPLFDEKAVRFDYELNQWQDCTLETEITFQGKTAGKMLISPVGKKGTFCLQLDEAALGGWNVTEDFAWTPEHPRLPAETEAGDG